MMSGREKYEKLVGSIRAMGRVAVAYSGGVDSTLLLKAAVDSGAEVYAFMAVGEIFFPEEQERAVAVATSMGVHVTRVRVDLANDERFKRNWEDRCYICKASIMQRIRKECQALGVEHILEGSQADDAKQVRPGRAALLELRVRSPLLEVGLSKGEVRELLRELGLPNWNAPSNTCLATRVPYDVRITSQMLQRIKRAEDLLAPYSFSDLRVRDHGELARIEVAPADVPRLFEMRAKVLELLLPLGYRRVSIDLAGYGH